MISHLTLTRAVLNQCCRRRLGTTSQMNFKFKLTEDMSKEFEEKQRAKAKPPSPMARHTKENTLVMGKVSSDRYKKVVKVGVPKHRLNDLLLLFVRELDNVQAHDENDVCKPGDWVLLRRDPDPVDKTVTHKVERVVHSYGNWIDPITNRRAFGIYYDDDRANLEKIKMDI